MNCLYLEKNRLVYVFHFQQNPNVQQLWKVSITYCGNNVLSMTVVVDMQGSPGKNNDLQCFQTAQMTAKSMFWTFLMLQMVVLLAKRHCYKSNQQPPILPVLSSSFFLSFFYLMQYLIDKVQCYDFSTSFEPSQVHDYSNYA